MGLKRAWLVIVLVTIVGVVTAFSTFMTTEQALDVPTLEDRVETLAARPPRTVTREVPVYVPGPATVVTVPVPYYVEVPGPAPAPTPTAPPPPPPPPTAPPATIPPDPTGPTFCDPPDGTLSALLCPMLILLGA